MTRLRDKLAEVILFFAVEWVASPEWRANYHGDNPPASIPTIVPQPASVYAYQGHLVDMHGIDPSEDVLWADEDDLDAFHSDTHGDGDCYPPHEHRG